MRGDQNQTSQEISHNISIENSLFDTTPKGTRREGYNPDMSINDSGEHIRITAGHGGVFLNLDNLGLLEKPAYNTNRCKTPGKTAKQREKYKAKLALNLNPLSEQIAKENKER